MQSSPINLMVPVTTDLNDVKSVKEATTIKGGVRPFERLLSSAVGAVRKASLDACAEENELDPAKLSPDNLPPALRETNVVDFISSLAACETTTAGDSAQGDSEAEGEDERDGLRENLAITSLVMGMLSLALLKVREDYPETESISISLSPGSEETDTADSVVDTEGSTSSQADCGLNSELTTEEKSVAESLALLLVGLLQTTSYVDAAAPGSHDSSQSNNQSFKAEQPVNNDRDKSSAEVRENLRFGGALSRENAGKSIEDAIIKLETLSDLTLQDKDTDRSRLGITAVRSANGDGKPILLVLNGTANFGSHDRLGGMGEFAASGAYDVDRKTLDLGTFIEGVSSKTMPVIGQEADGTSSHNDGGERRESGPERQAFLRADQVLSEGQTGQQKGTASVPQTVGSAIERFERFERIAEQIAGKSGSHGLTVRLDIGNEESVVVGLKDLGQSVAVEVRASHQGLINLLQSQKESIIRHLEGKDVRTSFLIDPNASRTPDRRDRRETRRQVFTATRGSDKVFGTFLDTFA